MSRRLVALSLLLLPSWVAAQPARVEVATRGVSPTNSAAANSAVIDALLAEAAGRPVELDFPDDRRTIALARPINPDSGGARFSAPGLGATLAVQGRTDPVFIFGYGKRPGGKALTPDHFIDAFGKLDATAAPAAGRRWGYRTRANSWIAQGSGPFALGPPGRWPAVRKLTAEVALDTTDVGTPVGPIWSIPGVAFAYVEPGSGRWGLWLCGPEDTPGHQPTHKFLVRVPVAPGVHRVAWQADLDVPRVTAYVDGVQVAVTEQWAPVSGGGKPVLAPDPGRPYLMAATGDSALGVNYWPNDRPCDLLYLGHALYSGLRYADDGEGKPQRRLDGAAVTDASRYFAEADPDLIALLRFQEPPEAAGERLATVIAGPRVAARGSRALILSTEHNRLGLGPFSVANITVQGDQYGPYGGAVLIGAAADVTLEGCDLRAGAWAIDCWGAGANYLHRGRNLSLWGNEGAFHAVNALWDLQDVRCPVLGRNTFWTVNSRLRLRGLFTGDAWKGTERLFYAIGGDLAVDDANIDIESGQAPTRCVAELRTAGYEGGKLTYSRFRDVVLGGLKPGIPLVVLGQSDRVNYRARFDLSGLVMVGDDKEAIVRVDAPGWVGAVDVDYEGRTPAIRDATGQSKVLRSGPLAR